TKNRWAHAPHSPALIVSNPLRFAPQIESGFSGAALYKKCIDPLPRSPMKIHEYQAKELLAAAGAAIPTHIIVSTPEEAEQAFDQLSAGGGVVLKAQIHAGGRGQGQLLGYPEKLGGVRFCPSRAKARQVAEAMLKYPLKTKQTGPEGQKISKLMVQADAEPARELYLAMVLDRAQGVPVMMASAEGGMDIEEV